MGEWENENFLKLNFIIFLTHTIFFKFSKKEKLEIFQQKFHFCYRRSRDIATPIPQFGLAQPVLLTSS